MKTYAIFRRGGWKSFEELETAGARSLEIGNERPDKVRWIRTYALQEADGSIGTVCIYQADHPSSISTHSNDADLPEDEVIPVLKTVVVREDPVEE